MFDGEGQPVWYYVNGTNPENGGAVSTELTDKGVLIGPASRETPKEVDFAGNILWQCTDPDCGGGSSAGRGQSVNHHASKLSNGNYLLIRWVGAGSVVMPVFEEQDSENRVVWSLDLGAFVTPPPGVWRDWCHGNSVTVDLDKDEVYASCRWLGVFKLTRSDPALQWWLPASWGAAGMGDITFVPETSQFSDVHDPEIHADGTMLFYDNGGYDGVLGEEGNPQGYHSRAVEYAVDQAEKTATLTWEFPGDFPVDPWYRDTWYCPFWGDADRLPNGNYLITAGIRGPNSQSRVFEVTKDGQVVCEPCSRRPGATRPRWTPRDASCGLSRGTTVAPLHRRYAPCPIHPAGTNGENQPRMLGLFRRGCRLRQHRRRGRAIEHRQQQP
jgi:hypothetical protein